MRFPEPLFAIINPCIGLLLRSPLHGLASRSLMLMTFRGRVTGRFYTTPVRYIKVGSTIRWFTNRDAKWWPNLKHDPTVILRLAGRDVRCSARVIDDDPATVRELLAGYLTRFPGDAVYHEVGLAKDGSPVPEDLDRAASHALVVEAEPIPSADQ